MNVLSTFDGMSGTQLALDKLGVVVDNYFASEIDPYAIKITQKNFPDTVQLGSIVDLSEEQLLALPKIDLLVGGSSCQNLSSIGDGQGVHATSYSHYLELLEQGFEFTGESFLFWEFVRVLEIVKPRYFMVENVKMTHANREVFEEALGVKAILINSGLVSAQNRPRYYFTNIPNVGQPDDLGIDLQSILEKDVEINVVQEALGVGICSSVRPQVNDNFARNMGAILLSKRDFVTIKDPLVTSGFADNKVAIHKCMTLRAQNHATFVFDRYNHVIRKVTPTEREKLQNVPIGYTEGVSTTQRCKMLGNGFTINVIAHIFSHMEI